MMPCHQYGHSANSLAGHNPANIALSSIEKGTHTAVNLTIATPDSNRPHTDNALNTPGVAALPWRLGMHTFKLANHSKKTTGHG